MFLGSARVVGMAVMQRSLLISEGDGILTLLSGDGATVRGWAAEDGTSQQSPCHPTGLRSHGRSQWRYQTLEFGGCKFSMVREGHWHLRRWGGVFPNGGQAVSTSGDQTIRVWDVATGTEFAHADLMTTLDMPQAVAIAPGGAILVGTLRGVILRYTVGARAAMQ